MEQITTRSTPDGIVVGIQARSGFQALGLAVGSVGSKGRDPARRAYLRSCAAIIAGANGIPAQRAALRAAGQIGGAA